MVKLQETENQIVTDYEVYDRRPSDSDLLIGAVEAHQARLGRTPRLVAADAAFYSAKNEVAVKAKGVKRVCIPNRSTKSPERKREQKKRWFRNGQKWRTGCEGRISVIKRRHGLSRCRYKGDVGMKRWVGLGVIADNLINIGHAMEKQSHTSQLQNWVGAVNYWDLRADFLRCRRSTSVAYFRNESLTPNRVPTCLCATFYQAPGTTFKTIFSPGSGRNSGRSPICTSGSS
jgi:hypothetical protein